MLLAMGMVNGSFAADSFNELLKMSVQLGIAGGRFGVALSLGSRGFAPRHR